MIRTVSVLIQALTGLETISFIMVRIIISNEINGFREIPKFSLYGYEKINI